MRKLGCFCAAVALAGGLTHAGLVAKWDFNNYDPANPTSDAVLKATVGEDGLACFHVGSGSDIIRDGTIGEMYVVSPDYGGSDAEAKTAANMLGGGNYALAIPKSSHVRLPIPSSIRNHCFTLKIRFWTPAASSKKYRCFVNYPDNTGDGKLFIRNSDNKIGGGTFFRNGSGNYSKEIANSQWHTITFSAGDMRWDLFLNETTEAVYANNANGKSYFNYDHFLLCADENGEDELMYIDYVELYDEASVYEGKLPHYSKAGLTGEWTFPTNNPLKATVGQDLVKHTLTGGANFAEGNDGVLPGDGYIRAGQNNDLICYHGLTMDHSYTMVMDVRVPNNENARRSWHGLFKTTRTGDGRIFIKYESGKLNIRTAGGATVPMGVDFEEWARVVFSYNKENQDTKAVYVNGVLLDSRPDGHMRPDRGGYFLLLGDEDGEDYDTDISYAAIYDRVLTQAEITELHSRPLAQREDESFVPTIAPVGVWRENGENGWANIIGAPLTVGEAGGLAWSRSAAPASATWVADLTLPTSQTEGGVLAKNENGVASGIYGTGSTYSGSFTTTTDPASLVNSTTSSTWGYWSENALDRAEAHRVAVTWAANGRVHYYVDGRPWGQLFPANANTAAKPTATMTFFEGLGATVTRLAAYDAPLTGDEIAALGGAGYKVEALPPTATLAHDAADNQARIQLDTVNFTIAATQEEGEYVAYSIDYGDGSSETTTGFSAPGTHVFSHTYGEPGNYTVTARTYSQNGHASEAAVCTLTLIQPSNNLVWSGSGDGNWDDAAWKYCDDSGNAFDGTWEISWIDGHNAIIPAGVTVEVSSDATPHPATLTIAQNGGIFFQVEVGGKADGDTLMETTDGITVNGTASAVGGAAVVDESGKKLLYVLNPNIPIIAHWRGTVGDGALTNPDNWVSTNIANQAISAAPTEATTVYLDGYVNISVPAGTTLVCKECLVGDATLTADCDWSGLGTVVLLDGSTVDLNGRNLTICGFSVTGAEGTATFTAPQMLHGTDIPPSELHVIVPEGEFLDNRSVFVNDHIRLVKEGAGVFTSYRNDQTYDGGTYVAEGTMRPGVTVYYHFGVRYTTIQVAAGATFDLWSRVLNVYHLQLDGGTIENTYNPATGDANTELNNLTLTADSRINFANIEQNNDITLRSGVVWDLGGYTLTITFNGKDPDMNVNNGVVIRNGTLVTVVPEGVSAWFHDKGLVGRDGLTLDLSTTLRLNDKNLVSTVQNLIIRTTFPSVINDEGHILEIYGTYTPLSPYGMNMMMMDGSAIDLSSKTGAWSTTFVNEKNTFYLSFENNGTVTLNLNGRENLFALSQSDNPYVLTWETAPDDSVKFKADADTTEHGYMLFRDNNGVKLTYVGGTLILLR